MRGNEGRWLAPSATPWDDAGERSLGPAETLVMACHRDLHGYRHAGASPGGEADFFNAYVLGVATGAMSGSHHMPAADRAGSPPETSSREGLGGRRLAKREVRDDSPLLARQAARRAGRREVLPALGQGPATQGGRDEATRAVEEPDLYRHRLRWEGQVALLAPRPGEARRARDAGGVCGPYPEGLPPDTRHGEEPQGARQGARADGGGPRPEADKDTPGQGESTTRGQRAMLPAGAVPELAFRIRQGAVGGCLDLFHVMMSPPDERMGKAACVLDRAMRFPYTLRYREYYRKKTSSKGTRSSWEPTTSKGGFLKNFSGQLGALRNYGGGVIGLCRAAV